MIGFERISASSLPRESYTLWSSTYTAVPLAYQTGAENIASSSLPASHNSRLEAALLDS
jgi:hypothetical protein